MKAIHLLRALVFLLLAPLATLAVSLAALVAIVLLNRPARSVTAMVSFWGRFLCRLAGVRVRVEGLENLEPGRPVILAANHQSQFDIMALQGYLDADFRWMAKEELFRVPVWGTAMRRAGYIPVDRSHGKAAMKSLVEAARRIAEGTSVIIFPEGTRSPDGRLQPFKAGAMVLAIKAGVPLVPVAISGTHRILPKGKLLAQPGRATIRVGKPLSTEGYTSKDKQKLAERLEREVAALLEMENNG